MPKTALILSVVLCTCVVLLTGCGGSRGRATAGPMDFKPTRDYGWDTTVAEPQAVWHPERYVVLARSAKGLMLLSDVRGGQRVYGTVDGTDVWGPQWIDDNRFVFGPRTTPKVDDLGQVVVPNYGLRIAGFKNGELTSIRPLTESGYGPRPVKDGYLASIGDRIVHVTPSGVETEYDQGFFPVPQPGGDGVAYQTVPVIHADYWTGAKSPGDLVIRWKPGKVDRISGGIEPVWTPWGGVVCTVLKDEAVGPDWHTKSAHKLVHIPGPGKRPEVIALHMRQPAVHPVHKVVAAVNKDGAVQILDLATGDEKRMISPVGNRPQWSADGLRLLIEEPHASDDQARFLRVYVMAIQEPEK